MVWQGSKLGAVQWEKKSAEKLVAEKLVAHRAFALSVASPALMMKRP